MIYKSRAQSSVFVFLSPLRSFIVNKKSLTMLFLNAKFGLVNGNKSLKKNE